ncbi:TKL protein kinase [Saprolegnia diclina VS20]|uniref:TKL protein kinase n=1 Tax=Saprolegnia diclina (strain VS20) TaxID=1156394 RepID=T0QLG8_SAPDV|nr:TKL protein kinase [Saprolegnia diclina VS20]EQC34650.1 TKL protein kinase [Saprolegnia diclina VS20]|eukprot:XP_008612056.1 TKL protein kinase [Saprolegnia diclina VS20]
MGVTTTVYVATALIASLAIGCALLLAGVVFLLLKRRNDKPDDGPTTQLASHDSVAYHDILESHYGSLNLAEIALYRLPSADITPLGLLASGAMADVFLGDYNGAPVAIKQLLSGQATTRHVSRLVDEIQLLALFDSSYIVALVGVTWDRPLDLKCVLEYMDGGDLRDKLARTNHTSYPWYEKLHCVLSVVEGLVYLHLLDIIHRDLKSRNVLLDDVKGAKLTDFDVSRHDTQATMTVGVGTYRWMAPEILQFDHYSVAADIYSFGMLLSELDSHAIPYAGVISETSGKPLVETAIMGMVMTGSLRPTFTYTTPLWIQNLASQCLAASPEDRPSAMKVSSVVRQHLKEDRIQTPVQRRFEGNTKQIRTLFS